MARLGMVIDTRQCVGCMDCVVACKTENDVPDGFCRDWISQRLEGAMPDLRLTITSERCNHCDNPPCVTCCPTGASHVHDYGKGASDSQLITRYATDPLMGGTATNVNFVTLEAEA
jgi:Fe-S-cluster-containing dehydrogenase component